ncbi:MAG TPA: hypothetical protein DEA71_08735 [Nitrospira sp.]|nr:hypothetical protein [Nitrospira sp.]
MMSWLRRGGLIGITLMVTAPMDTVAASPDQLTDLTGQVQVLVTLKSRDNFSSEYRYDISVRNLSPDTIPGDSLVIVLDKITNLAGEDHEALTGESFLKRFDVLDQDGQTGDGKPYFHIPPGSSPDLTPQSNSLPASIRIRNRDYVAVFTPSFKVFGQKRVLPDAKRPGGSLSVPAPQEPAAAANRKTIDMLIQLLIKKGVLTEEEWKKATKP